MHLGMLLQMAADGMGERIALGSRTGGITMAELAERAQRVGTVLAGRPGERVALVDLNSEAVPIALFGAALAGKAFVPINYRLTDDQLRDLLRRTAPATVIVGEGIVERLGPIEGIDVLTRQELLDLSVDAEVPLADPYAGDPDSIAVLLYTSGTTGEPKAAVLRHRNLASYIISTVEFAGAGEDEAAIVSVPPYHI
ncbi:MAG: AMP-binding protein, partial [Acidimicrobiales bacterium]